MGHWGDSSEGIYVDYVVGRQRPSHLKNCNLHTLHLGVDCATWQKGLTLQVESGLQTLK